MREKPVGYRRDRIAMMLFCNQNPATMYGLPDADCRKSIAEQPVKSNSATCASNLIFLERKRKKNNTFSQEIARKIFDFQISAVFFLLIENPQIFDESVKKAFDTQNPATLHGLPDKKAILPL